MRDRARATATALRRFWRQRPPRKPAPAWFLPAACALLAVDGLYILIVRRLYLPPLVALGGIIFLLTDQYVIKPRRKARKEGKS